MHTSMRVVTALPLTELWNSGGSIDATRQSDLSFEAIRTLIGSGPIRFVVADVGLPLRWVAPEECLAFWKREVAMRIADASSPIELAAFPGEYCYLASQWAAEASPPIVALQRVH